MHNLRKPAGPLFPKLTGLIQSFQNSNFRHFSTNAIFLLSLAIFCDRTSAEPSVFYFHNDHLGTPQVVTDENQRVIWKANYDPFGNADIVVEEFEMNLRFPGQYYDKETGYLYNYFRDYDPLIGRYIQSDPIGLQGGLNTYGYVNGNPINYVDPDGMKSRRPVIPNARQIRQQKKLQSQIQSLNQRLKNLQNKAERSTEQTEAIVEAIDHLKDVLDKLNDLRFPMECIRLKCPFDDDIACSSGPQMSPARTVSNGCYCVEYGPVIR